MAHSALEHTALKQLVDASKIASWNDKAVPLARRGVSRNWLTGFVRQLLQEINARREQAIREAEYAESHNKAGLWGRHDMPDLPIPDIPPHQVLDSHGFVEAIVKPLTAPIKAPLYAIIPEQFRGQPTNFVSHTWSSLLIGPDRQEIGSLNALENRRDSNVDEFIWIDLVCYNQHTFEAIAADMLNVIGAIGKVSICATPTPIFSRSWCLWELLSAHKESASVNLCVYPGYRNDKILTVNSVYRSFKGISKIQSSSASDQKDIYESFVSLFGSEKHADTEIDRLLRDRFSSDWHELQLKDEAMKFSPSPWLAGNEGFQPEASEPYYEPGLLDAKVYGRNLSVEESFQEAGVLLPTSVETKMANMVEKEHERVLQSLKAQLQEHPRTDRLKRTLRAITGNPDLKPSLALIVNHVHESYRTINWRASDLWVEFAHSGTKDDQYDSYVFGYLFGLWRRAAAFIPDMSQRQLAKFYEDFLTGIFGSHENNHLKAQIAIEDTETEIGFKLGSCHGDSAAIALLTDQTVPDQLSLHLSHRKAV